MILPFGQQRILTHAMHLIKSGLHPGKKTQLGQDLNHQPPNLIHDALDQWAIYKPIHFFTFGNPEFSEFQIPTIQIHRELIS